MVLFLGTLGEGSVLLCDGVHVHMVPCVRCSPGARRASPWATHFEVTNVNKDLGPGEAYTYDLEWSPDAIKPPIQQRVRGVPPAYIECALLASLTCRGLLA